MTEHPVLIHLGDCRDILAELEDASVDSIVTDPPYELGFMGKKWDGSGIAFDVEMWEQCLRVLKPGGHLLAFGGSRTWHRLTVAIEDAGFEIRDSIAWLYGSGFPKSLDVSKAIDKAAGAEREVIGKSARHVSGKPGQRTEGLNGSSTFAETVGMGAYITAPATEAARQWQGWSTALKPSYEPVCVAMKPYGVTDILDAIGSHITRLEDECRPPANGAARSSAPTPADSQEVRADTAPESAATPHEGEQARTTPTGAAAGSSAATDTSAFESEGETCWSTVTSWRACWDELYDLTSTSTTSTASSLTTDLRTLWSSIASLTVTSTPDSPTPRLTSSSTASAVDSLFAATVLRSRATLALSAPESATASTQPSPQGAGGRNTAFEPIVVARKPLAGTVATNVLEYGTGALNIDACRVSGTEDTARPQGKDIRGGNWSGNGGRSDLVTGGGTGRWPTNVVLDEDQAAELDAQTGVSVSRKGKPRAGANGNGWGMTATGAEYDDEGGASRFFPVFKYQAKAPTKERPSYVNEDGNKVAHSTVKPLALMRWLVKLVTPPGGVVLDPFAGSGTTVEACLLEKFRCIAIENEPDYIPLIEQRLERSTSE
ncbi:DNA methylase [Mycobacterium phage MISSy]|nr:DNA methylase [Mycobacterium phage Murica]ATS92704.1 DNA methylase [Mycobacterium phage MISSy]